MYYKVAMYMLQTYLSKAPTILTGSDKFVDFVHLKNGKGRVPKITATFKTFIKLGLTPPTPGVIVT